MENIAARLTEIFRSELEQQALKTESITTLSTTLSRVDNKLVDAELDNPPWSTAQECYSWAVAHADIVFPFVSLKVATEKIKASVTAPREWGPQGEEIRLAKRESTSASPCWSLINELTYILYEGKGVHYDFDSTGSVPGLDADETTKKPNYRSCFSADSRVEEKPLDSNNPKRISTLSRGYSQECCGFHHS